jgi:hypothetical protein
LHTATKYNCTLQHARFAAHCGEHDKTIQGTLFSLITGSGAGMAKHRGQHGNMLISLIKLQKPPRLILLKYLPGNHGPASPTKKSRQMAR